jgi:hypothetical protein
MTPETAEKFELGFPTMLAFLFIEGGASAARRGEPLSANPYQSETEQGHRWQAGWRQAYIAITRGE